MKRKAFKGAEEGEKKAQIICSLEHDGLEMAA